MIATIIQNQVGCVIVLPPESSPKQVCWSFTFRTIHDELETIVSLEGVRRVTVSQTSKSNSRTVLQRNLSGCLVVGFGIA